jgi:chemosensory pili system protein ChpA (sensor histidine kinase/response regulator)
MTSESTAARNNSFDAGPLSWVMDEIREALARSKAVLTEALAQDGAVQATALRQARTHLHQAHGALQIVDLDGVTLLTQAIEELFDKLLTDDAGMPAIGQKEIEAIVGGYQAVTEYLDELLAGAPHQPVRLYPYYLAVREASGVGRVHPSELFLPNLAIRPQLPLADQAAAPFNYLYLRQRFEKALLPYLKSTDSNTDATAAVVMAELIGEAERAQTTQSGRAFWWVLRGFAEVASSGEIRNEVFVKQVFGRINMHVRRLADGTPPRDEKLLRDALFFIAGSALPSPRVQQVRVAYQLEGMVPPDYHQKRYGQVDSDAVALARDKLNLAKALWNRIAGGDVAAGANFVREMSALSDAGARLNVPSFSRLLRELNDIGARVATADPAAAAGALGVEIAASLLFVENALNHTSRLAGSFADRAEALATRLLALVAGKQPAATTQWLDEMSRQAQQKQTMTALAGEMQSSLNQVEKMLDEYFSNPTRRTGLPLIDTVLHQIEGALHILDQDDAVRAVQHIRRAVQSFAAADIDVVPDHQEFQQVARNVGALSFFIETLQLPSENVKKRFSFDEKKGVFHANMIETESGPLEIAVLLPEETHVASTAAPAAAANAAPAAPVQAARAVIQTPAASVAPDDDIDDPIEARDLVGGMAASRAAFAADEPLDLEFTLSSQGQADSGLSDRNRLAAVQHDFDNRPAMPAPALTPAPMPASDEAVDAELLEIFLGEAVEVLACVRDTIPQLAAQPADQECLTTLRRSFHTLKGSGRMVGLMAFGEGAWSVEQVLNLRLSAGQGGSPDLTALLEKSAEVLGAWVDDLQSQGYSRCSQHALVAAAERVKQGGDFFFDEEQAPDHEIAAQPTESSAPVEQVQEAASVESVAASELPDQDGADLAIPEFAQTDMVEAGMEDFSPTEITEIAEIAEIAAAPLNPVVEARAGAPELPEEMLVAPDAMPFQADRGAKVFGFPEPAGESSARDDNIKRIGDLEISVPLHNIYLAETDELVRLLGHDFSEWRHESERDVNILAVHAAHSLAGSSATVGFEVLHDVAHALEMVLQSLVRKPSRLLEDEHDLLEQSVVLMKAMLQSFALGEMPRAEIAMVLALRRLGDAVVKRGGNADSEGEFRLSPFNAAEEAIDTPPAGIEPVELELAESAASGPIDAVDEPPQSLPPATGADHEPAPVSGSDAVPSSPIVAIVADDLDADLLPVFLEEGSDILPQLGRLLRTWQKMPSNTSPVASMLRLLHTIKGSARMAGAMALGQHMHEMEGRIEQIGFSGGARAESIEELLGRLDYALYLFEQLQQGDSSVSARLNHVGRRNVRPDGAAPAFQRRASDRAAEPTHEAPTVSDASIAMDVAAPAAGEGNMAPLPVPMALPVTTLAHDGEIKTVAPVSGQAPMVRVRADILDRLVNQAGEVSISRSRIENEVQSLRHSLLELTENVSRLRGQLREIEIQAESQMASQMAQSTNRDFDPLEFDRFTRLQELTRMMAESVNDVASVQQNLSKTVDTAGFDLGAQARLTRDLQQDLMRVRMVQFASVSERLYRVTRQASKELDKRVNLDIRGGTVEMDRSVLEKMTGPFEHLLRNAIVHGIESRQARVAAGKSETGELLVEIRQEGNEVQIRFSDDGHGLNLARIREKARDTGLLKDGADMTDPEVRDLIFHPGFSTAQEVTELAGRGVGRGSLRGCGARGTHPDL